jgi:glutathione S-transferase
MKPHLFVGNRNYSSWSLRGWLCLKWAGIAFNESVIDLNQPGYGEGRIADVLAVTQSGKVPAMRIGGETIWDTLAIAEWAAENSRGDALLPADSLVRAHVRATVGEMHAGFTALRTELPMNIRRRCVARGLTDAAKADIARIDQLWSSARQKYAKSRPFLFGPRSIADAFFVPVATRFRTYGTTLSPTSQQYCDLLLADAAFREWEAMVIAEVPKPFSRANIDGLYLPDAALA